MDSIEILSSARELSHTERLIPAPELPPVPVLQLFFFETRIIALNALTQRDFICEAVYFRTWILALVEQSCLSFAAFFCRTVILEKRPISHRCIEVVLHRYHQIPTDEGEHSSAAGLQSPFLESDGHSTEPLGALTCDKTPARPFSPIPARAGAPGPTDCWPL